MQELLAELAAEVVPVAVRAVAALAFTLVGGALELSALASLQGGAPLVGLWKVYVGAIALYAGVNVLGPQVLEAVRSVDA